MTTEADDASTFQRIARIPGKHQKMEEARRDFFPQASEGVWPR